MTFSRNNIAGILVAIIAILGGLYLYFLGGTVVAIAEHKDAQSEIRDMTSSLAELELEYYNISSSLSTGAVAVNGFEQPNNRYFVARSVDSAVALITE
ncbi:MAG: hypothetical protein OEX08_02575 [Candidatus Nomurabacteria bacterium]|nr:hypothetical protein [Candidatus Nomurabacteria bacterium]